MRGKRLLGISVDFLPKIGGISLLAHHLANGVARQCEGTYVLGPKGSMIPSDYSRAYGLIEDFSSNPKSREGKDAIQEDQRIQALIKTACIRYNITDIILFHPFYYGLGAILAAGQLPEVSVHTFLHGYEFNSQMLSPKIDQPHSLSWKLCQTIQASQSVICNSSYTQSRVAAFFEIKTVVVGCGIEPKLLQAMDNEDHHKRKSEFISNNRFIEGRQAPPILIAFAGRLVPNKRVERLLYIVSKSVELGAVIMGEGPEHQRLQEISQREGIRERVFFEGFVSEQRKEYLLSISDFISLMSDDNPHTGHVEGFGIALVEGIAHGLVPITSGKGGMIDIVRDNSEGLIIDDEMSAEHAAQLIIETHHNHSKLQAILQKAQAKIVSDFNWEAVSSKLLDSL
jgi:glycosyltransferase involved in cell wall biosynthesis